MWVTHKPLPPIPGEGYQSFCDQTPEKNTSDNSLDTESGKESPDSSPTSGSSPDSDSQLTRSRSSGAAPNVLVRNSSTTNRTSTPNTPGSSSFSPSLNRSSNGVDPAVKGWQKVSKISSSVNMNGDSPKLTASHRKAPQKPYTLSDITPEEEREVLEFINRDKAFNEKFRVIKIQKVTNEILNRRFEATMDAFSLRDRRKFVSTWKNLEDQVTRESVVESIQKKQKRTQHPNIHTLTTCHGTKREFLESVLAAGLLPRETTDGGYFGSARIYTYSTTDLDYAAKYGNVLLACRTVFANTLYPMALCDGDKFYGRPIPKDFDGLAVHVVPKTENPNEKVFVCKAPNQKAKYDEIVVPPAQIDISYVIEFVPKKLTRKDLQETIIDFLNQFPRSDLFNILNRKMSEINKSTQDQELEAEDVKLYNLLHPALNEQQLKTERIKNIQEILKGNRRATNINLTFSKQEPAKEQDGLFIKYKEEGNAYFYKKNWDKTVDSYKKALEISEDDKDVRVSYVYALIQRARKYMEKMTENEYALAVLDLQEALEYDSVNLEALGLLASIYFLNDYNPRQAYLMAHRAIATNPNDPIALRIRGAYYAKYGGSNYYDQALVDLTQSLKIRPTNNEFALLQRARLHLAMDNLTEAQEDCETLLRLDKKNQQAKDLKVQISKKK